MKGPGARHLTQSGRKGESLDALIAALMQMKNADEMHRFLRDLCTPAELVAFAERWKVAQMLHEGKLSYREIQSETGVSVTTVGRVARFLLQEPYQGYQLAISRIGADHK